MLNLFQHLIPLFFVSCLAYAELNVNFVEGFAVFSLRVSMCFARLNGCAVSRYAVSKKAECHAELVSASDSVFFVSCLAYAELNVNFVEGYLC